MIIDFDWNKFDIKVGSIIKATISSDSNNDANTKCNLVVYHINKNKSSIQTVALPDDEKSFGRNVYFEEAYCSNWNLEFKIGPYKYHILDAEIPFYEDYINILNSGVHIGFNYWLKDLNFRYVDKKRKVLEILYNYIGPDNKLNNCKSIIDANSEKVSYPIAFAIPIFDFDPNHVVEITEEEGSKLFKPFEFYLNNIYRENRIIIGENKINGKVNAIRQENTRILLDYYLKENPDEHILVPSLEGHDISSILIFNDSQFEKIKKCINYYSDKGGSNNNYHIKMIQNYFKEYNSNYIRLSGSSIKTINILY